MCRRCLAPASEVGDAASRWPCTAYRVSEGDEQTSALIVDRAQGPSMHC